MNELIQKHDNRATIRWKLLTGASALALTACISSIGMAKAEDADHSQLWIELGGQLSRLSDNQEQVAPPFFAQISSAGLTSPLKIEKPPQYSVDETGKLIFQPSGSDWQFSAAVRYGRSINRNRTQGSIDNAPVTVTYYGVVSQYFIPPYGKFADTKWSSAEKHLILDFQAGKDIGLGLFGRNSTSTLSAGVRFAQFSSKSAADVNADPTIQYPSGVVSFFEAAFLYHVRGDVFWEHDNNTRAFHGVGPSLSWQGSTPVAGNSESSELAIDWGVNAAVLFGRQEARGHHQSSNVHFTRNGFAAPGHFGAPTHIGPYVTHDRSRSVTVPNIGGSIGLSFVSGDAKVSFGYRADLFMNAMDTGIDVAKKSNMLFHGPYASISIGLGD